MGKQTEGRGKERSSGIDQPGQKKLEKKEGNESDIVQGASPAKAEEGWVRVKNLGRTGGNALFGTEHMAIARGGGGKPKVRGLAGIPELEQGGRPIIVALWVRGLGGGKIPGKGYER